jgi:hypothetical protein
LYVEEVQLLVYNLLLPFSNSIALPSYCAVLEFLKNLWVLGTE